MIDDVELSMVLGDGRASGSRIAAIALCDRTYSFAIYWPLLGLLLLDIVGEIREGLTAWLDLAHDVVVVRRVVCHPHQLALAPFLRRLLYSCSHSECRQMRPEIREEWNVAPAVFTVFEGSWYRDDPKSA